MRTDETDFYGSILSFYFVGWLPLKKIYEGPKMTYIINF